MIRTFSQHTVRPQQELTGKLWTFVPLQGARAGEALCVHTPSCWETYPGFGLYRGEGRYSTSFCTDGNVRIECKGVSHTASVYVDGEKVASHYNAYTAFSCVVRGLSAGEHTIEIVADNRFSEESALHVPNDYMSYGGISRLVVLERVGAAISETCASRPCAAAASGWRRYGCGWKIWRRLRPSASVWRSQAGNFASPNGYFPAARRCWRARLPFPMRGNGPPNIPNCTL